MTERSTRPEAMARTAKREDTTPKAKKRGGIRGVDSRATISEARSRGIDTGTNAGAAMVSPNKPLTEKQKLFVKHWAEGESILTAAVRAGYADGGQMAYRMVHMPNIQALKAKYEAKYEEASQMTRKKVMDMHLEAFEMAKLMSEPATMVSAGENEGRRDRKHHGRPSEQHVRRRTPQSHHLGPSPGAPPCRRTRKHWG